MRLNSGRGLTGMSLPGAQLFAKYGIASMVPEATHAAIEKINAFSGHARLDAAIDAVIGVSSRSKLNEAIRRATELTDPMREVAARAEFVDRVFGPSDKLARISEQVNRAVGLSGLEAGFDQARLATKMESYFGGGLLDGVRPSIAADLRRQADSCAQVQMQREAERFAVDAMERLAAPPRRWAPEEQTSHPGMPGPMAPSVQGARPIAQHDHVRRVQLIFSSDEWTALETEEVRTKLDQSPAHLPCECDPCNLSVEKSFIRLESGDALLTITLVCEDCESLGQMRRWPHLIDAARGLRLVRPAADGDGEG